MFDQTKEAATMSKCTSFAGYFNSHGGGWCNTASIPQWRRSRAFIKATKRHHWATTCSVSPRRPPGWQKTKQQCNVCMSTLLTILMAVAVRRYYTAHSAQWGRSIAFIKANKRHHRASTRSDIIKRYITMPRICYLLRVSGTIELDG